MSGQLTKRIEALAELDDWLDSGRTIPLEKIPEYISLHREIIERQQEEIEHWHDEWIERGTAADMQFTIGRARLNLAEQRVAELERRLRDAPLGGHGSHWEGCYRSHIDCAQDRIAQLEAALAAEREKNERRLRDPKKGEWKRKYFQARADLDAEREKRCVTCATGDTCAIEIALMAWADSDNPPGCTEWQQRNPVPNVAQAGDKRDAEGTEEAADGNA